MKTTAPPLKIALSILGENPQRKTGLTTAFIEFVACSLKLYPGLRWILFAGPNQDWPVNDPRVEVVRDFPAGDQLRRRLLADHFRVPAVARDRGADVMISTGFVPMRKCLPTVLQVVSLQHLDRRNHVATARSLYRRWITRLSWPKADLIITNSRFAAGQILSVLPQCKDRLLQAYEGLQHEQFNTVATPGEAERLKQSIGVGPGYFLWLSNFYSYKQADRLLAGYALLDAGMRRRHPLVMAGADWEGHRAACQHQARAAGLAEDVKFLGWVDDGLLAPLYRHALAHCLPSREETFGRTVIESMACGTPVIVNDIPIMHEVTEGQAVIVDFKDAAQVAQALKSVAQDAALRARLREGGLARAQQFTFEKFTSERIDAIERLVSARRSG